MIEDKVRTMLGGVVAAIGVVMVERLDVAVVLGGFGEVEDNEI